MRVEEGVELTAFKWKSIDLRFWLYCSSSSVIISVCVWYTSLHLLVVLLGEQFLLLHVLLPRIQGGHQHLVGLQSHILLQQLVVLEHVTLFLVEVLILLQLLVTMYACHMNAYISRSSSKNPGSSWIFSRNFYSKSVRFNFWWNLVPRIIDISPKKFVDRKFVLLCVLACVS